MPKKKLTKSSTDKVWSGVLGGISEYFGLDSTWVRIAYVVLSVCSSGFPGITLYILLSLIIPKSENQTTNHQNFDSFSGNYYDRNQRDRYNNSKRKRKDAEPIYHEDEDDWADF
ncbi:PspC domain-containing protein [Floricoccus penangensis]|uniref:PspC domain-containing protein n=1 Tax=Floricoccus penangensis TaxID=1859475 RepID=UPI00203DCB62|nr:PspC domain-containing protein [Floricoccus penangensis]URZ87193.1 PspC domain-containing protein [Floricoccus penangensis]